MTDAMFATLALAINGLGAMFVAVQVELGRRTLVQAQATRDTEILRRKREATIDLYVATVDQRKQWRSELPDDWDGEAIGLFIKEAFQPGNESKLRCLTDYLGYYEIMAVAVGSGIYDLEVLDAVAGSRLRVIAANYQPYFDRVRQERGAPSLFVEFQWLAGQLAALRGPDDTYQLAIQRIAREPV